MYIHVCALCSPHAVYNVRSETNLNGRTRHETKIENEAEEKKRKFANMQTAILLHTTSDTYVSRAMVYAQDELYRWSNATGLPLASISHLHSVASRFALVNEMESEDCNTQVKT